jgi:hypothetical protein
MTCTPQFILQGLVSHNLPRTSLAWMHGVDHLALGRTVQTPCCLDGILCCIVSPAPTTPNCKTSINVLSQVHIGPQLFEMPPLYSKCYSTS